MTRLAVRVILLFCVALSAAAAPQIVISRFPPGILALEGTETVDFVIANVGDAVGRVQLQSSSAAFSVSPSLLLLDPGANRLITIAPETRQGGFHEGGITLTVDGGARPIVIPVRLFVPVPGGGQPFTSLPEGSLVADTGLIVAIGLQNERRSERLTVSNVGGSGTTGIPGADVPWIIPRSEAITVGAGGRATINFEIDPTLRPDQLSPLGAILGTVSFLYPRPAGARPMTASVMHISKVAVVAQQPTPLAANEVAAFVPGLIEGGEFLFTDLFFSNRAPEGSLSDLRLFYSAANSATYLLAAIPLLPAGVSAWFPSAPNTLYNVFAQTGTVQARSTQHASVSISAIRVTVPDQNRYFTALPILTSERAARQNERIVFAGVDKGTAVRTDIHLQESAGFGATYTIDFFDGAGAMVGQGRTGSLLPFGYVTLNDGVPTGARSARVTNTSSGTARITGYAAIIDQVTGDWWTSVDSTRPAGTVTDLLIPVITAGSSTFDVFITNASTTSTPVTVGTRATPSRGRAVRRGNAVSGDLIRLSPLETRRIPITDAPEGYVRIGGPAGAISATGRLTRTASGRAGSFGTGVPAVAASSAAEVGVTKRFSRANDVPNSSPPALLLIETARKPATVRVTIRFNFPAGSTVSGQANASKLYEISAGQLLTLNDITRDVLGAQRDSLGTLWNLVVDVQVVAGEGRVLPYLRTIETSGDVTIAVD